MSKNISIFEVLIILFIILIAAAGVITYKEFSKQPVISETPVPSGCPESRRGKQPVVSATPLPVSPGYSESRSGNIVVNVNPPEAELYFEGAYIGTGTVTLSGLPKGTYYISASAPGYEKGGTSVSVTGGLDSYATIALSPLSRDVRTSYPDTQNP